MSYFRYFQKVDYDARGEGFTQKLTNLTHFSKIGTKFLDDITFYSFYNIQDGMRPDNVSYELYGTAGYYWTFFLVNPELKNVYQDWPKSSADLTEFAESKYNTFAAISAVQGTGFGQIADRFQIGETVQGGVTGALGKLVGKYPTLGYLEIEPTSGTFDPNGEGIFGTSSQDFLSTSAVVKKAYAPRWHVDVNTGERVPRRTTGTEPYTNFDYEYDKNLELSRIRVIKKRYIADVARAFESEMKKKGL